MARKPAVAGQFYPAEPERLRSAIESYTPAGEARKRALGALCPHAGYAFSGPTAGRLFGEVHVPETVLVLNPSHAYSQPAFALWTGGPWETPLGEVPLHEELTDALAELPQVTRDDRPHVREHSAEVILPFLQYHNPHVRIAVICITASASLGELKEVGGALSEVLDRVGEPRALIVASSDMSHESGYGALDVVNRNDPVAIARMERLDADGLYRVCRQQGITMCGVLPAVCMMMAVAARGATRGILVSRATSADSPLASPGYVVGYAGMMFV